MGVRINLDNACRYLNGIPARRLDGLKQALETKAQELGVEAAGAITPETTLAQAPTGNIGGVLRFVNGVQADSSDEDKAALATLLATVRANYKAAGIVETPPEQEPEQAAEDTAAPARRRIARRRAARRRRRK